MGLKAFLVVLSLVFAAPLAAEAQQPGKVPQVGVLLLDTEDRGISGRGRHLVAGLRELGWIDGQNIALRFKFAGLNEARLASLARELVNDGSDVIVAISSLAVRAARHATPTIPIVMAGIGDPIGAGFVTNLARPDGNITGTSLLVQELGGKRLELLREILPQLTQVGVLYNPASPAASTIPQIEAVASRLSLELRVMAFRGHDALPDQFTEMRARRVGALVVSPSPPIDEARSMIAALALKHRVATIFAFREFVEAGGLISYGSNLGTAHRRAATYVDKILKGAKPVDLPIEQPTNLELVINLKTAKALGLTMPPALLLRADQVIE